MAALSRAFEYLNYLFGVIRVEAVASRSDAGRFVRLEVLLEERSERCSRVKSQNNPQQLQIFHVQYHKLGYWTCCNGESYESG